jgi:DNA-binding NarL/FixJ family response regulator
MSSFVHNRQPGPAVAKDAVVSVDVAAAACSECGASRVSRAELIRPGIALRATIPQAIAAALLLIPTLTPRERVTFELLGLGYDNRSIARVLEISERTAKRHVTAILGKLQLESRLQAGLAALIVSACPPVASS